MDDKIAGLIYLRSSYFGIFGVRTALRKTEGFLMEILHFGEMIIASLS
jgi:hypothetical protein